MRNRFSAQENEIIRRFFFAQVKNFDENSRILWKLQRTGAVQFALKNKRIDIFDGAAFRIVFFTDILFLEGYFTFFRVAASS